MDATINGIKIHYTDTGVKSGLPVVLVHGMTFDHTMWEPQIDFFGREHRVIAFDMRGHGRSEVGDGQYTYRMFVDDLIGLLDHLGIDKAVLCGLSMGGSISIRTCEYHPDRVMGLVLCDTTCSADTEDSKKARELAIASIKKDGLGPFTEGFIQKVFAPSSLTTQKETVDRIKKIVSSSSPLGVCGALLAQAARTDLCPGLSGIRVPTLLVVGADDVLSPPDMMEYQQERIPGSKLEILPAAGHVSNLENTPEYNRVVGEFLREIAATVG